MIAYGIKMSIDNGFTGDVVLEAKTSELVQRGRKGKGVHRGSDPYHLRADQRQAPWAFRGDDPPVLHCLTHNPTQDGKNSME